MRGELFPFHNAKLRKKLVVCKHPPTLVRSENRQLITTPYQAVLHAYQAVLCLYQAVSWRPETFFADLEALSPCKCGARRTQSRARSSYAEPKPTFAVASQMRLQSYNFAKGCCPFPSVFGSFCPSMAVSVRFRPFSRRRCRMFLP